MLPALKKHVKSLTHKAITGMQPVRKDLALEHWNVRRVGRDLALHGVNLSKLIDEFPTPLHVLDEQRLQDNVAACLKQESPEDWPVELFFSYKTTPVPAILCLLRDLGAHAEVISEYELWLAIKLGIKPENIIFNGPAKSKASLEQAIELGILSININQPEEIPRIREIAQRLQKQARVSLRVVLPGCWSGQFGISVADQTALHVYREALAIPEFKVVGLHCHHGHLMHDLDSWRSHVRDLLSFCEGLGQELGFVPELIDFGGSIGIPSTRFLSKFEQRLGQTFAIEATPPNPEHMPGLSAFSAVVQSETQALFTKRGWPRPRIALELGRAVTGNAQMLLTRVMSTKAMKAPFTYGILDAGVNIASIVKSEFHQIFPLKDRDPAVHVPVTYRLTGPICHLGDVLYQAWRLPQLQAGDGLAIMDSGAYFIADANSFSFPQPGVVAINRAGAVRIIRRPESYQDLVALDDCSLSL